MDEVDRAAYNRLAEGRFIPGRVGLVLSSERGKAMARAKQRQAAAVRSMLKRVEKEVGRGHHSTAGEV